MKRQIDTKILNGMLGTEFPLPEHATAGSAGLDIRACIDEPVTLDSGDSKLIGSGFAIHIKDPNIMGLLVARSGLGVKHGILISQGAGIIDSDYHGEIFVALWNRSRNAYTIQPGERICQLLFMPVLQVELNVVNEFLGETDRGARGFGSTGKD